MGRKRLGLNQPKALMMMLRWLVTRVMRQSFEGGRSPKGTSPTRIFVMAMFATSKDLCPRTEEGVSLGVSNFFASSKTQDQVGQDGLPVTPSTTEIFGRFQFLTVRMSTRCL